MCSVYKRIAAGLAVCVLLGASARVVLGASPAALRVCSDPNNLPFSNQSGAGFENKIAELLARDLGRPLVYLWAPQRRGFLRNTLLAGRCDVVMGIPAQYGRVLPTRAYYRSSYAFVTRADRHLRVRSFDDPRLATLLIGIQITGNDYQNPPAAQALASRHLIQNVRGYTVYGDYSKPDPQSELLEAVAGGVVDIAVAWGPLAGYYAQRVSPPLDVTPVRADAAAAPTSARFAFDIAVGVRPDDHVLHDALDAAIVRHRGEIRRILTSFGVPLQ
jgi:mxaJ protein